MPEGSAFFQSYFIVSLFTFLNKELLTAHVNVVVWLKRSIVKSQPAAMFGVASYCSRGITI